MGISLRTCSGGDDDNPPIFYAKNRLFSFQNVCLSIVIIGGCNILDMFANENGEIDVERIISDLPTDKPIEMDLRQLSPILPNRVLLITKEDLDIFLKMIS